MTTIGWIYVGVAVIIAAWLYIDAQEHDMDGAIWAILGLLFSFITLAYYLFACRGYVGPSKAHKAMDRSDDIVHWTKYGGGPPRTRGTEVGTAPGIRDGDPDFIDEEVERLIEEGKFSKAREYVNDMIKVAKDMNDTQGIKNYKQYLAVITEASTRGTSR